MSRLSMLSIAVSITSFTDCSDTAYRVRLWYHRRVLYLQPIVPDLDGFQGGVTHSIVGTCLYRNSRAHGYALIDPPAHPTYDLYKVICDALEEDAGDLGDITTLSTYVVHFFFVMVATILIKQPV